MDFNSIDWDHTGMVLSHYTQTPLAKKKRLVRLFDRTWFHGRMLAKGRYGQIPDEVAADSHSPGSIQWLEGNAQSWCQSCNAGLLENREHHLAVCNNVEAKRIRATWLSNFLKYTHTKLPLLYTHLRSRLKLSQDGSLSWDGSTNSASLILSGCVPKSWWTVLFSRATCTLSDTPSDDERARVDKIAANFTNLLRWLSTHLPKDIWAPMHKLRSENFVTRCQN
uniref:Uncharacterized protein n=1 Tax=Octactis speculum TaxID=3111310 RepID=A0A7S2C004_9STRA